MHELPRTGCSRWVIIDPPALLSGFERPDRIVTLHAQPPSETAFGSYHQWLQMVEFPVEGPGSSARTKSVRIQKFIPNTQRAPPMREYSEINIHIPSGVTVLGFGADYGPRKYTSLIQETPASWGYMIPLGWQNSWDDKSVKSMFTNLYIMPLHGDGWVEAEAAGWKLVRNGLPPNFVLRHYNSTATWVWGDDGILCLLLEKTPLEGQVDFQVGFPTARNGSIVCYEEDWSM